MWTKDFALILSVAILANILTQGINNGLPIYIDTLGGEAAFSGFLILEFSIVAGITRLISGYFVDNMSRYAVMIVGGIGFFIGSAGSLVFPGVEPLVVFRFFQGIGLGAISTAAATSASDIVPETRIGEGIGLYGLGQSIGMAVGPALAVTLVLLPDVNLFFIGFTISAIIQIVLIATCRYEYHPQNLPSSCTFLKRQAAHNAESKTASKQAEKKVSFKDVLHIFTNLFEPHALVGAVPMFLFVASISVVMSFTSLYATQQNIPFPSMFFVCAAIVMTVLRIFGGKFFDLYKPIKLYLFPVITGVIAFVLLMNTHTLFMLCLAGCVYGLSMGTAVPILNSVAIKNTPSERWGAANALFSLIVDIAMGIGATGWGRIIDVFDYPTALIGAIITIALSYAVAFIMFPKTPREK